MFELLTGIPPFVGSSPFELFCNIEKQKIRWTDDFPPLAKNLISKILKQDPKQRPTLEEILKHRFFEENQTFVPILPVEKLTDKQLIESFLINPENKEELINNIVSNKKNSFAQMTKKIDAFKRISSKISDISNSDSSLSSISSISNISYISGSPNSKNVSGCNVNNNFANSNIGSAIVNTNIVNIVNTGNSTSVTKDKKRIAEITELNEKLKKENAELKKK